MNVEIRQEITSAVPNSNETPQLENNTPWQAMFDSRDDRAFITTMGFDVETFELIVRSGFGTLWQLTW